MDMTSGECEDSTELLALGLIITNTTQAMHLGKINLGGILKCKPMLIVDIKTCYFGGHLFKTTYSLLTKAVWKSNFNPL